MSLIQTEIERLERQFVNAFDDKVRKGEWDFLSCTTGKINILKNIQEQSEMEEKERILHDLNTDLHLYSSVLPTEPDNDFDLIS